MYHLYPTASNTPDSYFSMEFLRSKDNDSILRVNSGDGLSENDLDISVINQQTQD